MHTASRIPLTIQWLAKMPPPPNATATTSSSSSSSSGGGSDEQGQASARTLLQPVSTVDITPTILDAAGGLMATTGLFDGVSLLPLLIPSHPAHAAHHRAAHTASHTTTTTAHSADASLRSIAPSAPSARGIAARDGVLVDMCQQVGAFSHPLNLSLLPAPLTLSSSSPPLLFLPLLPLLLRSERSSTAAAGST